jgi:hypothetical protein
MAIDVGMGICSGLLPLQNRGIAGDIELAIAKIECIELISSSLS